LWSFEVKGIDSFTQISYNLIFCFWVISAFVWIMTFEDFKCWFSFSLLSDDFEYVKFVRNLLLMFNFHCWYKLKWILWSFNFKWWKMMLLLFDDEIMMGFVRYMLVMIIHTLGDDKCVLVVKLLCLGGELIGWKLSFWVKSHFKHF